METLELQFIARRAPVAFCALLLIAVCPLGCSTSDAKLDVERADRSRRPGDMGIVPQTPVVDELRPLTAEGAPLEFAETAYADGNPTHYADGSAAYHVDGSPVDYRPRNIQRELATMPTR